MNLILFFMWVLEKFTSYCQSIRKMVSPRKHVPFHPKARVPNRQKSKIMKMSLKDLRKTQENMRLAGPQHGKQYPGQLEAKIAKKSDSKSSQVQPTSKDMKQHSTLSLKNHLRPRPDMDVVLNEPFPLKKKRDVPTRLKAMSELAHKETKRLKERPDFDQQDFSKSTEFSISNGPNAPKASKILVLENNCSNEGKERPDGIVSTKEKGKYHTRASHAICAKQEGPKSLKGIQHMQQLQRNLEKALSKNDNQRELIEINFESSNRGQVAKCDGGTNNDMSKKRKEPLLEEKAKTIEDDGNKDVQGNNTASRLMKKQRCVKGKDDEEGHEGGGNHNPIGVGDDNTRSLSQDNISKDGHVKVSMVTFVEQQHHCCSKPIDKPNWSGIFKIDGGEYISLVGHLSTKSCEKAWSLSRQLLPLVELKRLPRSEVWPKAWEASKPSGDNIGIYFFPHVMRQDKDLDELIKEVMENDLVLRAIIGDAEMLIFPSILLPNHHKTFQRKHYLWGVFKPREDIGAVVAEPLSAIGRCAQEVEKEKQQHVSDQKDDNLQREEPNTINHRLPA
uniref:AIPP2-like SPOC-like domain-containing protein n=1 Tax=Setaria viridis TaxID=4556 RepID=A0A4U6U0B2_SETVI|nr:uncharacterized protein LOC117864924 [Setaria viridis]TKW07444.1 hypothetical protein SEVIR_7G307200v2 [Setaria viridis]